MTELKRVLVLNHFAAPRGQAGGTRHVELFSRLPGWEYVIVAARTNHLSGTQQNDEPGFKTVPVTPYAANGSARVLNWASYALTAFVWSFRRIRIDVVYASSPHLLTGLVGWLLATVRRVPFILEIRDLWPKVLLDMGQLAEQSVTYRVLCALETFLYRRADGIVIMAEGARQVILERGVDSRRINYIPNGADSQDFLPSQPREELRRRYGFQRFTVVYAGAHGPANGLDLILDASKQVRDAGVDIVLVGGGVQKAALVARADREGLDNVRFLNPIPKDEIPDLLHAADAGLHVLADVELFRYGVSPNKVFDYMGAGLPVITNAPGLVSNLIDEANCGVATAPSGVGRGILQVKSLQERVRYELGANGREWLNRNQSRSAMSRRLAAVLENSTGVE